MFKWIHRLRLNIWQWEINGAFIVVLGFCCCPHSTMPMCWSTKVSYFRSGGKQNEELSQGTKNAQHLIKQNIQDSICFLNSLREIIVIRRERERGSKLPIFNILNWLLLKLSKGNEASWWHSRRLHSLISQISIAEDHKLPKPTDFIQDVVMLMGKLSERLKYACWIESMRNKWLLDYKDWVDVCAFVKK